MSRFRFVVPSLLVIGIAGVACGQVSKSETPPAKAVIPKMERPGVWQPADGGVQMPLWPASTPLAKPDSGDRPEGTGNGTGLVGGSKWHWASYVTRPTMTIYRAKGRNVGTAMLVLPGGGFEVIATDLEGTEICD